MLPRALALSLFFACPARAQLPPRWVIAFDTSGSMAQAFNGTPTFGDGVIGPGCTSGNGANQTPYCGANCTAGIDTDCDGRPDDSRIFIAKNAVRDLILAFGDVEFALARFSQLQSTDRTCTSINGAECAAMPAPTSYGNPQCNSGTSGACQNNLENQIPLACRPGTGSPLIPDIRSWVMPPSPRVCINYQGQCGTANLLVGLRDMGPFAGMDNVSALLRWMDHAESAFMNTTVSGNFCNHATSGDCELRAHGPTPLDTLIAVSASYLDTIQNADPAAACRDYSVLLITDGNETCLGNPVDRADVYLMRGITTYVVGVAIDAGSRTQLNDIAAAGGTGSAFFADDPVALSAGLADIVAGSLRTETCNFMDEDCDGRVDEGVQNRCLGCGPEPAETCNTIDDDCDGTIDEGTTNRCNRCGAVPAETCNGADDDCDGPIDEGVCGGCVPSAEICDNVNSDCDAAIDENLSRPCGTEVGDCAAGTETCIAGVWRNCSAVGPSAEVCDGRDNDCNGVTDGLQEACGSDVGECQAGNRVCTMGAWGSCVGQVGPAGELCDNRDNDCDGAVDDGNPGGGGGCGSDVGECAFGTLSCMGGALTCSGGTSASPETCNDRDDDCDAVTDESVPTMGPCGNGTGECSQGVMTCMAGAFSCVGGRGPSAEICNGRDDDCDGTSDEGNPGGGAACGTDVGDCSPGVTTCAGGALVCVGGVSASPEVCDASDDDCDGTVDEAVPSMGACGVDTGECRAGTRQCMAGAFQCVGAQGPVSEVCNGRDDDCDGVNDDGNPGGGAACGTSTGACEPGTRQCSGGSLVCAGAIGPAAEACNGADDDCDAATDEGNPGGGGACGTNIGECTAGTSVCTAGALACAGGQGPRAETCNGLDDDCDGPVDEGNPGGGAACGTNTGECTQGALACTGGALSCAGAVGPTLDLCDDLDNDCDGPIDEGNPGGGGSCGSSIGTCRPGTLQCTSGTLQCSGGVRPVAELCNAADDDCDGSVDEAVPTMGSCGSGVGECDEGVRACVSGTFRCTGDRGPVPEVCDGRDNDCDGPIDEGNPGGGMACGTAVGECELGTSACRGGALACDGGASARAELCNARDDDCDGLIDEGNPGGGGRCGATDAGECEFGAEACVMGALQCTGQTSPSAEICDGRDNDCDGTSDEGNPEGGAACGDDTGECRPGVTLCMGGALLCDGAIGATPERCNARDDDCDGIADDGLLVGAPCGDDTGECSPGVNVCRDDAVVCEGETGPIDERCDVLDNDCDGAVDEGIPLGAACGSDVGVCVPGRLQCIGGRDVCVGGVAAGRERCNCEDDDCDGASDEAEDGPLCPGASECVECQCALACVIGEFGPICPTGRAPFEEGGACHCVAEQCDDADCAGETIAQDGTLRCAPDSDEVGVCVCRNNACTFACDGVACEAGTVCDPNDPAGRCVEDSCRSLGCASGELCNVGTGECEPDPCETAPCAAAQACREGTCETSCAAVDCADGERCIRGACAVDRCASVTCAGDEVCDDGECVPDRCIGVRCPMRTMCDPVTGTCERDPCDALHCPGAQRCEDGECTIDRPPIDAGVDAGRTDAGARDRVLAAGGCVCRAGVQNGGSYGLLFVLLALLALRRRSPLPLAGGAKGRRTPALLLAILLSACTVDPYCLDCGDAGDTRRDAGRDSGTSDAGADAGRDAGPPFDGCSPTAGEICNGFDDDCDLTVDEGFDTQRDVEHCGGCSRLCAPAHAFSECTAGACVIGSCDVGFYDLDGRPENGCEYRCLPTEADDSVCDLRDNDCDGDVDEDVARDSDPSNCGMCGRACRFPHSAGSCVASACTLGPCEAGFHDVDGELETGCEYACSPAAPAVETCNARDDDCDGNVDEGDPGGGGGCGSDTGECARGIERCTDGSLICVGGVRATTELCNGRDDDCDASTDESNPEGGALCGIGTGTCAQGRIVCSGGSLVCTGASGAVPEICDGLDNDCDGSLDEGDPGGGAPCGSDVGECAAGVQHCRGGILVCEGAVGTTDEICNGRDDDCDGTADDGDPGGGGVCGSDVGQCAPGRRVCSGGTLICMGGTLAVSEVCNALDDDCDGATDEGDPGGGGACGTDVGACTAGRQRCVGGAIVCQGQVGGTAESCNGIDDDCDGITDDGNPGGGANCGNDIGLCRPGTLACTGGSLVCSGGTGPIAESCDGLDQDCDGRVDEGVANGGPCGTTTGECEAGVRVCSGGAFVCTGGTGPASEICDGRDNDCDGASDEMNPGGGARCGSDVGDCTAGTLTCTGGALVCAGAVDPAAETCNGSDQDCDGSVDEGNPGGGGSCGTDVGECETGTRQCMGGSLICVGGVAATTETCDGRDEDCDAAIDDGNPGGGAACGIDTGACSLGTLSCAGGSLTCTGGIGPATEACNGLDDDCDGATDEGNPGGGGLCGVSTGECAQGTRQCTGGSLQCVGGVGPVAELCDSRDNDCDGPIDEGNPQGGGTCGADTGECSFGTRVCTGGALTCTGGQGPVIESCNARDDDCDTRVDEDFNTMTNVNHCGMCGRVCAFANAVPQCTGGTCGILACNSGFYDADMIATNGCEYACSFNGAEVCNGRDDDCDGPADEGLMAPTNFCNPNGVCGMAGATCNGASGWVCNYPMSYQPGGETLCDSLDNDCDGLVDEPFPNRGTSCSNGNGGCRRTGTFVCNAMQNGTVCNAPPAATPMPEACDHRDNDCDAIVDEAIAAANIPTVTMTLSGGGGTFEMFRYEASRPDATLTSAGTANTVACSRDDVRPWTNVTWAEANDACCRLNAGGACTGLSGWRLCDAEDWELACEGTPGTCNWAYAVSCSASSPLTCNGREHDSDTVATGNQDAVYETGSATFPMCYAEWGVNDIYDLSGNVKEWTYTEVGPGVHEIRGGAYNNVEAGRTCTFAFTNGGPTFAFPTTGFRCCRY